MDLFISKTVSSIVQIVLFAVIPLIWWRVTAGKRQTFAEWIGLKRMRGGKKTFTAVVLVSAAFLLSGIISLSMIRGIETAVSEFAGLGIAAVPAVAVYAAFNTAFPEELLFRGFLLKRTAEKLGFHTANMIQALLFGVLHGAMFLSLAGVVRTAAIVLLTGGVAWLMGYINEKYSGGSILPGWIIHTVSNLFSGLCAAFSVL